MENLTSGNDIGGRPGQLLINGFVDVGGVFTQGFQHLSQRFSTNLPFHRRVELSASARHDFHAQRWLKRGYAPGSETQDYGRIFGRGGAHGRAAGPRVRFEPLIRNVEAAAISRSNPRGR